MLRYVHCARVDNKQFNIDYLHWTDVFNKIFMQSVKKIKKRDRRWMTRRKKTHSTPSLVAYCLSIEGIWFAHGKNAIICAIWFTWICCLFFLPSAPIIYILLYRVVAFWRVAQNSHETEKKNEKKKRRRQNDEDKKKHTNIFSFFL